MTAENKNAASLMKQPFVIAIALVIVALIIVLVSQKSTTPDNQGQAATDNAGAEGIKLKPPTTASAGQNTPKIVQSMSSAGQKEGQVAAPGLESLVSGLEQKVKADPSVSNRLLLAQTYNELGMQDKALAGMRELQKENPEDGRVNLVLSSMLSRSNDEAKLKESLTILDKLSDDKTVQQYLVNMYKGDALIRVQDHDGALKYWKLALESMPAADNRRAVLEKRIADLSTKGEKPVGSVDNSGKS
jgi:cytochrome c-type biogenesis protein CcmH/NrfG